MWQDQYDEYVQDKTDGYQMLRIENIHADIDFRREMKTYFAVLQPIKLSLKDDTCFLSRLDNFEKILCLSIFFISALIVSLC